jgi:formylglycine-generating enzyme required for sulfatase activity/uncharacterized caspase-like protein
MRKWFAVFGLLFVLAATAYPAFAENRVALVIGENVYRNLPDLQQLHNAVNDARAMKAALEALHFEVDIEENLDRAAFIDKLSDFGARLERDDIAFFFYAGHGVSFNGANYLLPSDIPAPQSTGRDEQDRLADQSIAEMRVLERIRKSGARLAVVVLDACRDNPLKDASDRSIGDQRGLEPPPPVHGVLEIYSAGPGQTALDGDANDANSVFTKAFVDKLRIPGLGLRDLAYKTQAEVYRLAAARGHDQFPVVSSQIISDEDIYLAGRPPAAVVPSPDLAAGARQETFNAAIAADTDVALRDFVEQYPSGQLADIARQRLARLAALTPAPVVTPSPPAPCGGLTSASLSSRVVGVLSRDETCALKRGDVFKECADCPAMVVIPEGSFTMGSPASEPGRENDEGPQHVVRFARAFAVGKFDVTKDEFAAFVREKGYDAGSKCWSYNKDSKWEEVVGHSWRDPGFPQTGSHPVACVNWDDANAHVAWLSKKTNQSYRLLSDSEWEYSARAGKTTAYFWGNAVGKNNANCDGCGSRWDNKQTSPVDSFAPNAFGLHDMHGNVWQWVEDCYRDSYKDAPDDGSPVTSGECSLRALRGGSWDSFPGDLRAAGRDRDDPSDRISRFGFRVARTLLP